MIEGGELEMNPLTRDPQAFIINQRPYKYRLSAVCEFLTSVPDFRVIFPESISAIEVP